MAPWRSSPFFGPAHRSAALRLDCGRRTVQSPEVGKAGTSKGVRSILDGYANDASALVPRFEAISSAELLAPVIDLLPAPPSRILEVGAGTGRDAAWLAGQGHHIVAVEPVEQLRSAGMALHPSSNIRWADDRLPGLAELRRGREVYDLILLIAVWQHLRPEQYSSALVNLGALTAPDGCLIMSLRHGPGSPQRPCFPALPEQVIRFAEEAGLSLIAHRKADSVQRRNRDAGVTWSWLCFRRR